MSEDSNRRAGTSNPQTQPESNYHSPTNQTGDPRYGQQGDHRMSQQDNSNPQVNPQAHQGTDPNQEHSADPAHQYYQAGQQPSNEDIYAARQAAGQYQGHQTQPAHRYYQGQEQASAQPGYDPQFASAYHPQQPAQQYAPQNAAYTQYQPADYAQQHTHQSFTEEPYSDQQSSQGDYAQYSPQPQTAPAAQGYEQPYSEIDNVLNQQQANAYGAGSPYDVSANTQQSSYTPDYDYAQAGAGYQSDFQSSEAANAPGATSGLRNYEPEFTSSRQPLPADPSEQAEPSFSAYNQNSGIEQRHGLDDLQNYDQPRELAQYSQLDGPDPVYSGNMQQSDAGFFEDEYNDEAYGDFPEEPKKRKPLVIAGALVGALALGGSMAVAYKYIGFGEATKTASTPPLIQADKRPVKEQPKLAGGKQFPNRNKLIYDRLQDNESKSAAPERIVSRQEQVFDTAAIANSLNETETSEPDKKAQLANSSATPVKTKNSGLTESGTSASSSNSAAPRKVRTLMIKPDGTIVKQSAASTASNPQSPSVNSGTAKQAQAKPGAQPSVTSSTTKPIPDRLSSTPQLTPPSASTSSQNVAALPKKAPAQQTVAAPTQKPKPQLRPTTAAATPAPAAATSSSSDSGYAVQVAARRSQTEALAAFADLQQKYSSLLTNYRPIIQRADLGEKGVFYRLRVGPMKDKKVATSLCNKLKSAGLKSCWVLSL